MRPRQIRRRCKQIIRGIEVPAPFDIHQLVQNIAVSRRRPIELRPMAMPATGPTGMWIATASCDYILYEQDTAALHQEHIIVHEIGHLLADHDDPGVFSTGTATTLLPHLTTDAVSRTGYCEEDELMAETIASMILGKVNRWKPVSEWDAPADGAELRRRVHMTLEPSVEGQRR